MKAITTLFESILGQNDTLVWMPTEPKAEFTTQAWGWGG